MAAHVQSDYPVGLAQPVELVPIHGSRLGPTGAQD
jgi:hypothetical protein